jgi:hypothetical protein
MIATPCNRCSALVDCSSGAADAVCSEGVGGSIEGNYGPSILQNDRLTDDEAGQKDLVRGGFAALMACCAME